MTSLFFMTSSSSNSFRYRLYRKGAPILPDPSPAQKQSWPTVILLLNDKQATSQASDLFNNLHLKHYQHRGSTNLTK